MTGTTVDRPVHDRPVHDRPVDDAAFASVSVDRSWWSWAGAHGGHVAALGLTAMRAAIGDDRPVRTLTTHFLAPVDDRPLTFEPTVVQAGDGSNDAGSNGAETDGRAHDGQPRGVRPGRAAVVCSSVGWQGGVPVVLGTALFGAVRPGPEYRGRTMPAATALADTTPIELPVDQVPFARHLEIRPAGDALPLAGGPRAELVAWLRFADRRPLDAAAVVLLTDALPPALFALWTAPRPVPSAELTVHLTDALDAGPVGEWALVVIRTEQAGSGWALEDSEVWSTDGRLLALGRQCRRVRG